jgi:hypothetical protein
MTPSSNMEAAHVDVAPVAAPKEAPAAAIQLLDGDEVVQLSIKPSLWYIPIVSARFVLGAVLLGLAVAIASRDGWSNAGSIVLQILVLLALARVAVAALQWASRLYVLTNRRVMRFRGVLNVDLAECPLAKISAAELHVAWYQGALGLGDIRMRPAAEELASVGWEQVSKSAEIHELLLRAIRRAQSGD